MKGRKRRIEGSNRRPLPEGDNFYLESKNSF